MTALVRKLCLLLLLKTAVTAAYYDIQMATASRLRTAVFNEDIVAVEEILVEDPEACAYVDHEGRFPFSVHTSTAFLDQIRQLFAKTESELCMNSVTLQMLLRAMYRTKLDNFYYHMISQKRDIYELLEELRLEVVEAKECNVMHE